MMSRLSLLAAGASMVALGACTTPMGTTGGTAAVGTPTGGMSRAQQGAIAGAATGAILGAVRDSDGNNKARDAARGAIVGGLAGAAVGATLDAQQRALQSQIATPGVQVVNTGTTLNVVLPEGVLFATDSAAVSGPAQSDLLAVAQNLRQYPNSTVQVIGHTDSTGEAAYNLQLSQRRAQSVANILIAGGVQSQRIAAGGQGESQPVASNDTPAGRSQNRRVEIIIRPNR